MVKYCPRCGAKTEEIYRFCRKCGTNLNIVKSTSEFQSNKTYNHHQKIAARQHYDQNQQYLQQKPKKSNVKVIGINIAIILIIVVIVVIFLFVFNWGNGHIEGAWKVTSIKMDGMTIPLVDTTFNFISDGSLSIDLMDSSSTGNWEINNNKLYLYPNDPDSINYRNIGFDYSFSNSDSMTLTYSGFLPESDGIAHSIQIDLEKIDSDNDDHNGQQNGNGDNSELIGTWSYDYSGYSGIIIFNNDNSLEIGYQGFTLEIGTWSLTDEELCLSTTENIFQTDDGESKQCFDYSISNEGSQLTLTVIGQEPIILTK